MAEMKKCLLDLYVTVDDLIKSEFNNSTDIKIALESINDAIEDFDGAVKRETDKVEERIEAKEILKEKMKKVPLLDGIEEKYKDLVANLAIKYNKELPSDEEFRERIFRRIVDLDDNTVMNLAYGKATIESVGKSVGKGDPYENGLKALHKDSFLPKNIESTYGLAINNIYKHKGLFLSFLIDYFRKP